MKQPLRTPQTDHEDLKAVMDLLDELDKENFSVSTLEIRKIVTKALLRWETRNEHTQHFYSSRIERLGKLAHDEGFWDKAACVIANGSASINDDAPCYEGILNLYKKRAQDAEYKSRINEEVKNLARAAYLFDTASRARYVPKILPNVNINTLSIPKLRKEVTNEVVSLSEEAITLLEVPEWASR